MAANQTANLPDRARDDLLRRVSTRRMSMDYTKNVVSLLITTKMHFDFT